MFGYDPIDLFDPSPYGPLAYYGHLVIGTIALTAALVALYAKKGSKQHRLAGFIFAATVLLVCITSLSMLANVLIAPLLMAVFTAIYAVGGALLALRPGSKPVLTMEVGLSLFEIAGLIVFLSIALPAARQGVIPIFAPLVILVIPLILLAGDAYWFTHQKDRHKLRIARHLNRMVWAFVVVLRAPLVELAAAGLPLPQPLVIFGPIVLAFAMLWYFRRRYVRRAGA